MCPSAMPTSWKRDGKRAAKSESPVPSFMPAVSATIRPSASASSPSAAPKASLQEGGSAGRADGSGDGGFSRSKGPTPCQKVGSFSAGAKPRPFSVTTCRRTLRSFSFATASAVLSARTSCPSTGPMYLRPISSK